MPTPLVVVGGGGFGKEVVAIAQAINAVVATWELLGVIDDGDPRQLAPMISRLGTKFLGGLQDLPAREGLHVVIAVGAPDVRERLAGQMRRRAKFATLIHPDATVGSHVAVGRGTVIAPGARLSTQISVGEHVHIDQGATVGHDTVIYDYVRLNPQACISGHVTLHRSVSIGANATVLQGLAIAEESTVGAGAVVVRNVAAGIVVKGVPAR